MNNLDIGIVVEVNGFVSKVATFDNANHSTFIHNGSLIKNVSVNSFVIISQGFIKIVARIISESVWDNLNKSKEYKFDNRFAKDTIKRVIELQTIGYIKNNKFYSGASFLPMIGNSCKIPTTEEINQIYINNYMLDGNDHSVSIGKSLNEGNDILLPINLFFASHIGIFGNTGSGKSNTLHKLYFELFALDNLPYIKTRSSFLVLDFNGEYVHEKSFGIRNGTNKDIYELSSRQSTGDKFPIKFEVFFEEEMLSILFAATQQTQKPFLSRLLKRSRKYGFGVESCSLWVAYLIKCIFTNNPNLNIRDLLVSVLERYIPDIEEHLTNIKQTQIYSNQERSCFFIPNAIFFNGDFNDARKEALLIEQITTHIKNTSLSKMQEFELRCHLQLVNDLLFGNVVEEHIHPLLRRIESRMNNMENYIEIVHELPTQSFLQIISLKDLSQESKKIISLFISKMHFDFHKSQSRVENKSFHLIIDEAHNVLSTQSSREQDSWKDYRLELFEEIIKEGRKFGFFLTLSSQRPADISPTILSQVHNFFLHKLVNERDLQIMDNSISTLDRISKSTLPVLAQGVCIISGTALSMPVTVDVDFINNIDFRPKSDTVKLTEIWG
ncbi:ATP-binding protein [Rossellomorea marisflavi]|nr:ATP-binding protein [Rossellomorea marisflavi]